MEIAFIICLGLFLNQASAVLVKYAALHANISILFFCLLVILIFLYFVRIVFWIFINSRWKISYIYPIFSIGYLLSFLIGIFVFGETFQWERCLGAIIITIGVSVISRSSDRRERVKEEKCYTC